MRKILLLLLFPFAMFAQEPYHGVPPAAATWLSTNGTLAGPWNPLTGAAGTDPYIGTPRAAGLYYSSTGTQAGPWYPCTLAICFGGGGSTLSLTSPTSTLTLSPSPITGTGTLDLNLAHANTWTGQQTFVAPALGTPASGVLTNATGLPAASVLAGALANGMTATTQTTGDNTTKVATDAFVLANGGGGSTSGIFPIDSYGGVGDGNLSANTGTDNTSAFASALAAAVSNGGGTITFDCGKQYRFLTTGPTITTSSISLQGSCPGAAAATYSSLAGAATTIFTSSASATVVDFHGTSTTATITNNSIHNNFHFARRSSRLWCYPGSCPLRPRLHFQSGNDQRLRSRYRPDYMFQASLVLGFLFCYHCAVGLVGRSAGNRTICLHQWHSAVGVWLFQHDSERFGM